ncbi:MAG: enoyl-CoA hydratase/isomerase family protein [Nitrospirae bacterium]|nr:enoyl-CoA hydratase/isomerase family protein [Nitrospirota bacterium]
MHAAAEDEACRVLILTGEGGSFCAGADLRQPPNLADSLGGTERVFTEGFHGSIETLAKMPKPAIAQVRGAAAGFGLSLALA